MIQPSELILNPDGSVYHLSLLPENIAHDIIFVGDQDRVSKITQRFDSIEFTIQKREFKTQTGVYKGKRLTVISTGIGPDNIDIVLNELDALVNIDLVNRTIKPEHTALNIIRIGTSGALQPDIPVNGFVLSTHGLGLDNMLRSYVTTAVTQPEIEDRFIEQTSWDATKGRPYAIKGSAKLQEKLFSELLFLGITATSGGFYGPQGRVLRLPLQDSLLNQKMDAFRYNDLRITNLEMETAAIYGLSALLGHRALSLSAIVANRANGQFSANPEQTIEQLIEYVLDKI